VGDVAGMGADLFGSYVATVLATMVLGRETLSVDNYGGFAPILLPMLIAGCCKELWYRRHESAETVC
jgi:K(+)-stimulated pyrophosphate-energized sodium pump